MPLPSNPGSNLSGSRAERAAQLRKEMESQQQTATQRVSEQGARADQLVQQGEAWTPPDEGAMQEGQSAADEQTAGTGPVGQGDYVVGEGECMSSIAKDTGHFWETLWNHPDNAELKEIRKDPNILLPGDRVTIPALEEKTETGGVEERHRFVRLGEPAQFCLRLIEQREHAVEIDEEDVEEQPEVPRANLPYQIVIDEQVIDGVTDADGKLSCNIPGNAQDGLLILNPGEDDEQSFPLVLGTLKPITEIEGVVGRLRHLGYDCGPEEKKYTQELAMALKAFREDHGLPEHVGIDDETRAALVEAHGA
ncbi:MAG: hypothetical protein ACYTHJ_06785 [Planctomycetota bacterium]|jgi:N-acetylmuramoyl-L-alanine amidase